MANEILLIDDDSDELEVFSDALKLIDADYQCFQARTLDEALSALKTNIPAYIFLDFNMPKLNGLECLALLKESGLVNNSRIVLYSNYITDIMKKQVIQMGAFNYIKKPNTIIDLSEKLRGLLNA